MPGFSQALTSLKNNWLTTLYLHLMLIVGLVAAGSVQALAEEAGVANNAITIGGVMDLEGESKGLGLGMKAGIEAALKGEKIQGRSIEFVAVNDFYVPENTVKATKQLVERGIFLILGNVGTPTAKVALPILAENKIPAVGFFTGAELLRPGVGDIINFRASYVQEVASIIEAALAAGVKSQEVCAYVQNESYGMAGVLGIKTALTKRPDMTEVIQKLEQLLAMQGEEPARNGIGPVGVYPRNAQIARDGYNSLKNWEKISGNPCRLVVTVGTYAPIASFIGYARYKGENWIFSAVSFTGASNFTEALKAQKVSDGVIMTQVVPALDPSLPIVEEARKSLGGQLGYVSLEGFIVGKMFLTIARSIKGDFTRDNFLKAVRGQTFDLGGLKLDFTTYNQGPDLVLLTHLDVEEFKTITPQQLTTVFQN